MIRNIIKSQSAKFLGSRTYHSVPPSKFKVENGLGSFMSSKTLQSVSQDWQQGLLDRLNDVVRDTELENLSVVQTVINSATDRKNIVAFNYASEALNNSFFFANLKQEPHESSEPTGSLARHIEEQFGSIQEFKSHFGATANALTGGGYVWLVSDSNRRIGIVTTYGSGTILIRSRQQRGLWNTFSMIDNEEPSSQQSNKLNNNQQSPLSSPTHSSKPSTPNTSNPLGTVREYSSLNFDSRNVAETGDVLTPLLCLGVFERCYLTDFGVWGREEYIKNFWKVVDWSKVEEAFDKLIARRVSL